MSEEPPLYRASSENANLEKASDEFGAWDLIHVTGDDWDDTCSAGETHASYCSGNSTIRRAKSLGNAFLGSQCVFIADIRLTLGPIVVGSITRVPGGAFAGVHTSARAAFRALAQTAVGDPGGIFQPKLRGHRKHLIADIREKIRTDSVYPKDIDELSLALSEHYTRKFIFTVLAAPLQTGVIAVKSAAGRK